MTKMCLRAVGPMSKVPLEHPRTLRTGLRSANKIKKVGRKWTRSTVMNRYFPLSNIYFSFIFLFF